MTEYKFISLTDEQSCALRWMRERGVTGTIATDGAVLGHGGSLFDVTEAMYLHLRADEGAVVFNDDRLVLRNGESPEETYGPPQFPRTSGDWYERGFVYPGAGVCPQWMKPALTEYAEAVVSALDNAYGPGATQTPECLAELRAAEQEMAEACVRMGCPYPETDDQWRARIDKERAKFLKPFERRKDEAYRAFVDEPDPDLVPAKEASYLAAYAEFKEATARAETEIGPRRTAWEALGDAMLAIQTLGNERDIAREKKAAASRAAAKDTARLIEAPKQVVVPVQLEMFA